MQKITVDNYIFFIASLLAMLLSYAFIGVSGIAFAVIAVIHTFAVYSAKDQNGDYVYTFIWLVITIAACYVGFYFKLTPLFYLFLFLVAIYYYLAYNKDPFSDKAIPFVVVLSTLGTTLSEVNLQMFVPYILGTVFTLIGFRLVYKDEWNIEGFKGGLFSKKLYANRNRNVLASALVFGVFLSLSMFLPHHWGLERVYWSSVTFIFLLPPGGTNIVKNTVLRFIGAVLASYAVVLIINVDHSRIFGFIVILALVFFFETAGKLGFLVKTFTISFLVLLLLEYSFFWDKPNYVMPDARIYETFIGGCLALLGSFALNLLQKVKK